MIATKNSGNLSAFEHRGGFSENPIAHLGAAGVDLSQELRACGVQLAAFLELGADFDRLRLQLVVEFLQRRRDWQKVIALLIGAAKLEVEEIDLW